MLLHVLLLQGFGLQIREGVADADGGLSREGVAVTILGVPSSPAPNGSGKKPLWSVIMKRKIRLNRFGWKVIEG